MGGLPLRGLHLPEAHPAPLYMGQLPCTVPPGGATRPEGVSGPTPAPVSFVSGWQGHVAAECLPWGTQETLVFPPDSCHSTSMGFNSYGPDAPSREWRVSGSGGVISLLAPHAVGPALQMEEGSGGFSSGPDSSSVSWASLGERVWVTVRVGPGHTPKARPRLHWHLGSGGEPAFLSFFPL